MTTVFTTPAGNFRLEEQDGTALRLTYTKDPPKGTSPLARIVQAQLNEYFAGTRKTFDFPYTLSGTPFRRNVWQALEQIPYGETRSYQEIATAIGNQRACRAVGGAIHHNPILIAVPCHRVIGADGSLTGFGAGLELKEKLLTLEGWNTP